MHDNMDMYNVIEQGVPSSYEAWLTPLFTRESVLYYFKKWKVEQRICFLELQLFSSQLGQLSQL
ncbi:hypothetical protein D3C75_1061950 [compost metagenome]